MVVCIFGVFGVMWIWKFIVCVIGLNIYKLEFVIGVSGLICCFVVVFVDFFGMGLIRLLLVIIILIVFVFIKWWYVYVWVMLGIFLV